MMMNILKFQDGSMQLHHDKDWLVEQLQLGKTVADIAKAQDVTERTIERWLKRYKIDPDNLKLYISGAFIHRELDKGKTQEELAAELNISPSVISYWKRKEHVRKFGHDRYYKSKEWLTNRYIQDKWSIKRIADFCNVSKSTIHYHLKNFKIPLRDKLEARKKAWQSKEVIERFLKEATVTEVAKKFGVTRQTLYYWIHKLGIGEWKGKEKDA